MTGRRLRVAFLLPHFRVGGAERAVLNWIGALDRARFEPLLFLTRVEGAFLDRLPADVDPISLGGGRAFRLPTRITQSLAEHDVAVAYSATNAMNLALLAARVGPAARIVSEHTSPAAYLAEAKWPMLRRAAMRRLYPRADAIAVPTDRIGTELCATLERTLRVVTIPNPVIGSTSPVVAPRPAGPLRLVSAGRLVPAKGFDTLIAAAALLMRRGLSFRLAIFGEGPLHGALAAQIAAAGLHGIVTLAGHSAALDRDIAAAELFVLASRREGFGNVIVEAMAAGTPVLATRCGGPETIIRDGATGFLVDPDDAAAMAEAIERIADDRAACDAVVAPARNVARDFSIEASTRQFEALIETVAKARSTAP